MRTKGYWDVFCSYSPEKENQNKVIEIMTYLTSLLDIKAWLDLFEIQSGERLAKIYEGITKSQFFLCFVTPEYSDNKDCINELCLAKKLGKEIIFFINIDTTGMNQEMLTKNVLKQISYYMGDAIYYRRKEELLEPIKKALTNRKKSINTDSAVQVYVSFHISVSEIALKMIKILGAIFDAKFEIDKGDSAKNEKIAYCDAFIAIVNSWYTDCDECKKDLAEATKNEKQVIRINLDRDVELSERFAGKRAFFDFYKDEEKLYAKGQGREFIDLVFYLQNTLPKPIEPKQKSIDLLVIAPQKHKPEFEKIKKWKNTLYSYPCDTLSPNFVAVKEAKVIISVIDDTVNNCEKSIVELKFANLVGTRVLVFEDNEIRRLNADLKDLMRSKSKNIQFDGIENLSKKSFKERVKKEIKDIEKKEKELDSKNDINEKLLREDAKRKEGTRLKTKASQLMVVFITILVTLAIGFIVVIGIGGYGISKEYIVYKSTTIQSTISSTDSPKQPLLKNICFKKFSKSPNFPNQGYVPFSKYTTHFKEASIVAIVEICLPKSFFVVNLLHSLSLVDEFGIVSKTVVLDTFLNRLSKIDMVATENEIIISDSSNYLYRYSFDLQLIEARNLNLGKFPIKLTSLYYEPINKTIFAFEINNGIHMFDENLNIFNFVELKINNSIVFEVQNRSVFFASNDKLFFSTLNAPNINLISMLCESGVVKSFFIDPDQFFYWTCAFYTNNSLKSTNLNYSNNITISKNGGFNKPYNVISIDQRLGITYSMIDSKNRLIVVSLDGKNSAIDYFM